MEIKLKEVVLNYEIIGKGNPLIFLHGNGEDLHIFDELSDSLKNEYKIYLIDSRNHGKSSHHNNYSYDDMACDIIQFIDLLNLNKPSVLGFSDGGIIALKMAIIVSNKLDKLVLCGANYHVKGLVKTVYDETLKAYKMNKNPLLGLMIKEPKIKHSDLKTIKNETLIIVARQDVIRLDHTIKLSKLIAHSKYIVLDYHSHDSYIVNQNYLKDIIKNFI